MCNTGRRDNTKILFAQPHTTSILISRWGKLSRKLNFFPNLQFQQLAAVTPKEYQIKLIDERHKDIDFNQNYDLIAISYTTPDAKRAHEIADEFKKHGKTVVLTGWHPTGLPDEAKQHCDSVIIGETELTWPDLLNDFNEGNLKPFYKQEKPVEPELIPAARRDIGDSFFPIARIQATRGCPYKCEFCRIPPMEGNSLRKRPVENVIQEIKSIPQKFLYFSDASLTLDPEYSKTLFREMKGLRKKFCCSGNPDVLGENDEFLQLAKEAGCCAWFVGFDSISQKVIDYLGKTTNKIEKYPSTIKKIHDHKMAVFASFVFGFDTDTLDIIEETYNKVCDWEIDVFETNTLTPFPGTPLYDKLEKEGRILTKNWEKYNEGDVVFKLKNMPIDEYSKKSWKITCDLNWGFDKTIWKMKNRLKLGFYPYIVTTFQTHFW